MKSLLLIFSLSFLSSVAVAGPIHDAAARGNLSKIQNLMNKGVNVDSESRDNYTPLQIASGHGHLKIVKFLIANGAKVNAARSTFPLKVIYIAAQEDCYEVTKLLIKNKLENEENNYGMTALHYAIQEGHFEIVKFLIANGANVNAQNTLPLRMAMFQHLFKKDCHRAAAAIIISEKNSKKNNYGITPLNLAKKQKYANIVQYLISKGAK